MKLATPMLPLTVEITEGKISTLVIENRRLFVRFLRELYMQAQGEAGSIVLSEDDKSLKISSALELVTDVISLELNDKRLLTKICKKMEQEALGEEKYRESMELLGMIEKFMLDLSDRTNLSLGFDDISIASLIKATSVKIVDDSSSYMERIFLYMEAVREFLGERLFVFVNLRAFFDKEDMQRFVETSILHRHRILLLESFASDILVEESRVLLDNDICLI